MKHSKNSLQNKIVFGDCQNMKELEDNSVHLVVTSPPYFNAPFDYPDLFKSYNHFLVMIRNVAKELKRVMAQGRIAAFVCDDTLINGEKYPVVADITKIFVEEGFKYRERIVWVKPEGYIRISRRSGVLLQHPYPMYFYPDNLQESILLFQNGKFDYKSVSPDLKEESRVNLDYFKDEKLFLNVWKITNVLPTNGRLEEGIAAFPKEIPNRLINLFSFKGDLVLDPFLGSGTSVQVANSLNRNGFGYEIDVELVDVIKKKLKIEQENLFVDSEIVIRDDVKHLRKMLQGRVKNNSTSKKTKKGAKINK
jgi:DNA modification methylase